MATARKMIGATNPLASEPGTIRGDFAIEVRAPLLMRQQTLLGLWVSVRLAGFSTDCIAVSGAACGAIRRLLTHLGRDTRNVLVACRAARLDAQPYASPLRTGGAAALLSNNHNSPLHTRSAAT